MIENELETVKEQLAERDAGLAAVVADRDEVRSQLATVQAENEALNRELKEAQSQVKQVRQEYIRWRQKLSKVKEELGIGDRQPTTMRPERDELRSQLAELQKNPAPVIDLPEPADLLNQLKARRKKSRADLVDVEVILEIIADGKGLPEPADLLNQLKGRRKNLRQSWRTCRQCWRFWRKICKVCINLADADNSVIGSGESQRSIVPKQNAPGTRSEAF
jgi:chromosome segregation ATPase